MLHTNCSYKLFNEGKSNYEIALTLSLRAEQVVTLEKEYLKLKCLDTLPDLHEELGDEGLAGLLGLFREMKRTSMPLNAIDFTLLADDGYFTKSVL